MQGRTILCNIDLLPTEHGINPRLQSRLFCQLDQELYRLVRNSILGVIEVDSRGFCCHTLTTGRIMGKKIAEMEVSKFSIMTFKSLPCRTLCQQTLSDCLYVRCHLRRSFRIAWLHETFCRGSWGSGTPGFASTQQISHAEAKS